MFVSTLQVAPTIHVASIDPATVTTADATGEPVEVDDADARSHLVARAVGPVAELDYPDGSMVRLTGRTGSTGVALVRQGVTETGTYTFTVRGVARPPAVYDPSENVETSDSVTIP